jgi:predicted RNase H-like nuclease (RuvC/YqgF family)
MKIVDIVYWILNGLVLVSLIYGYVLRRKTKKILKSIEENSKKRFAEFTIEQQIAYDKFVGQYMERLDLLSKENNKLREENEEMKERLTNLGFKE